MAPITQKTQCQPNWFMSQPINGANKTREKYCEALKMDEAVPRSRVGNHAATKRPLPGNAGAKLKPARNSSPNNTANARRPCKNPVKPIRKIKNDQRKMAAPYTRFEPNRSSNQPAGSC